MIQIHVNKASAHLCSPPEVLTAGMVKVASVRFVFSADWDGLTKTAVFTNGRTTVDVLPEKWDGDTVAVAPEVLAVAGRYARVGVYGTNASGVVLPTVWATLGKVQPAADPSGDASTDPTLPVWAQLQEIIGDLNDLTTKAKNNLVAAINEAAKTGSGGSGSIDLRATDEYIQYSNDGGAMWENLIALAELKGEKGDKGDTGGKGADGKDGKTPVKGTDYFTDADKQELAAAAAELVDVPVTSVNGATGAVKTSYYVTITPGDNNSATADKTPQEVYAAYTAGYAVYAIVNFNSDGGIPFVLPLAAAYSLMGAVVLGFGALGSVNQSANPQYPTVAYNGSAWQAWVGTLARASDIPTALKNPYALNIKIGSSTTSYDGSGAKTVEIPEGGYTLTDADKTEIAEEVIEGGVEAELGPEPLPAPATAAVGQIVKIKAVDAAGKITETEAVDMQTGGGTTKQPALLHEITLEEAAAISVDMDDVSGGYAEYIVKYAIPKADADATFLHTTIAGYAFNTTWANFISSTYGTIGELTVRICGDTAIAELWRANTASDTPGIDGIPRVNFTCGRRPIMAKVEGSNKLYESLMVFPAGTIVQIYGRG